MLKKSDLASQFDLVVKQEIKNYQDSLYYINQSINEIHKSIDLLKKDVNTVRAMIENNKITQLIDISAISSIQNELSSEIAKLSLNVEESTTYINKRVVEAFNTSIQAFYRSNENKELIYRLEDSIKNIQKIINDHKEQVANSIDQIYNRCSKEIKSSRNEILSKPSDSELIKKCLEDKLETNKIDSEAVLKEVKILNRAVFTQEKKIENIYTLIKRMQEKG